MGKTKYVIYLTSEEKARLYHIIDTEPAATVMRAKILLGSDFANPKYCSAHKLAEELGTSHATVQAVRAEYAKLGLEGAIYPKGKKSYDRCAVMTDEKRQQIRDMIKEPPPFGLRRWTVLSICDECVKRCIFEYVAKSVIQKFLHEENIDLKNPNNL